MPIKFDQLTRFSFFTWGRAAGLGWWLGESGLKVCERHMEGLWKVARVCMPISFDRNVLFWNLILAGAGLGLGLGGGLEEVAAEIDGLEGFKGLWLG